MIIHIETGNWRKLLGVDGSKVFAAEIRSRVAWPNAAAFGQTAGEVDDKAAEEIDRLWGEIQDMLGARHG